MQINFSYCQLQNKNYKTLGMKYKSLIMKINKKENKSIKEFINKQRD